MSLFKKMLQAAFFAAVAAISAKAAGIDTGFVKDYSGNKVAGATVTYIRDLNTWYAMTDENGIYRFITGGSPQSGTIYAGEDEGNLYAEKPGYTRARPQSLIIAAADTSGARMVIPLAATWNMKSLNLRPLNDSAAAVFGQGKDFLYVKNNLGYQYCPLWSQASRSTRSRSRFTT
jgi:hypothetical protein